MSKAGATFSEAPLPGEVALREAFAELGGLHAGSTANGTAADQSTTAPPPKTVSQVLGEITWLMTQSPRHIERVAPFGGEAQVRG